MNKTKILLFDIEPYYNISINKENGEVHVYSKYSKRNLKKYINNSGYYSFKINGKQISIHQLIGLKKFGIKKYGYTINHIDGNKLNNSWNNLEYITIGDNVRHAIKLGLHVSSSPERSGRYIDGRSIKSRIKQYKHEWYLNKKKNNEQK